MCFPALVSDSEYEAYVDGASEEDRSRPGSGGTDTAPFWFTLKEPDLKC